MLDTGYWMPEAGYWMLDAGFWILFAGSRVDKIKGTLFFPFALGPDRI